MTPLQCIIISYYDEEMQVQEGEDTFPKPHRSKQVLKL